MISRVSARPAFGNGSKWAMAGRKSMQNGANAIQDVRRTAQAVGTETAHRNTVMGQAQVLLQQAKAAAKS